MADRIPVTPMVDLYRDLKRDSQRERLRRAERMIANPADLAKRFARSVKRFEAFSSDEAFYDTGRKRLPANPTRLGSTLEVASRLEGSRPRRVLGDDDLSFVYVDRELVPARTKSGAVFADGKSIRTALRLDLLLANKHDRLPIVAEVKVAMDKDPFFALIQALTLAAQLVTPQQLDRLRSGRNYGTKRLADRGQVDVYLLLATAPAAATYWFELREAARRLSSRLIEEVPVARSVRRIAALDLDLVNNRLRISKRFSFPDR